MLDLLDKKKSGRNLTYPFVMNLVKNLVHSFHALSASYSVGRAFQKKILRLVFSPKDSSFFFHQLLSKASNEFQIRKHVLRAVTLEAINFLKSDFKFRYISTNQLIWKWNQME